MIDMRGRSSKQGNSKSERVITDKNLPKTTQEPHLSGAYIRNLVKQLTSSRGKDTMNQKEHLGSSLVPDEHDGFTSHHQNLGESKKHNHLNHHNTRNKLGDDFTPPGLIKKSSLIWLKQDEKLSLRSSFIGPL